MMRLALATIFGLAAIGSQSVLADELSLLTRYELKPGADAVAVRGKTSLPQQVDQKACRLLLTRPQRQQLRQELAQALGFAIDDNVSYFNGRIDNERLWTADGWQHCSGEVVIEDKPANLAALAVRAAWQMSDQLSQAQLKQLLQLSLANPISSADAVTLIAHLAPPERRFSYLQQNLQAQHLSLDIARFTAASLYYQQQDYDQVLALLAPCNTVDCRQLQAQAEQQKEQQDAEKAFDLDSYFNP